MSFVLPSNHMIQYQLLNIMHHLNRTLMCIVLKRLCSMPLRFLWLKKKKKHTQKGDQCIYPVWLSISFKQIVHFQSPPHLVRWSITWEKSTKALIWHGLEPVLLRERDTSWLLMSLHASSNGPENQRVRSIDGVLESQNCIPVEKHDCLPHQTSTPHLCPQL